MPLVDQLNALLWAGQNDLPPTPDTLHLGCSYHLHSSHRFLSTWGVVILEKKNEMEAKWNLETFGKRKSEKEMETKNAPIAGAVLSSRTIE